ncbi:MAG: ABC transporter ATP-binding protein [Planctomycetota bacterium]
MLTLENLHKRYGETRAVDGLSLILRRGEILGLLGPNGAGKSTTVSLCCGLLEPDAGSVTLEPAGAPTRPDVRRRIGVAPQELAIYDDFTAAENVAFFARLYGLHGRALRTRIVESLAFVGLTDRRAGLAKTFSGGMKRRLNLACAIAHEPEILLLDEPTVGVDPQSRNAIIENVLALRRKGVTIVYSTHYMEEAQRLCDRVAIVDHGKLLALDTVSRLIADHGGDPQIVLETDGRERRVPTRDPLGELTALQARGELADFRVERPNLEAVFLHLTGRTLRD